MMSGISGHGLPFAKLTVNVKTRSLLRLPVGRGGVVHIFGDSFFGVERWASAHEQGPR